MKFLVDRCAGRRLADWLRNQGYDVIESRTLGTDPGDRALLELAIKDERILITIDTDFGAILFMEKVESCGLIRLPDMPADKRIGLLREVLIKHEKELAERAIITVRGNRIRISHKPEL